MQEQWKNILGPEYKKKTKKNKQTNKRKIQEPKNLLRTDYHEAWSGDYLLLSKDYNILSCSHNILYYSPKILFCSHKKDTLFPQERYFVHSIYYFVPTTYHIGTGTHKYGWVNQVLWEFMSIPMQASHHRQATNTKQKETRNVRKYRAFVCACVRERKRVSAVCGVILNTLVAFSDSLH